MVAALVISTMVMLVTRRRSVGKLAGMVEQLSGVLGHRRATRDRGGQGPRSQRALQGPVQQSSPFKFRGAWQDANKSRDSPVAVITTVCWEVFYCRTKNPLALLRGRDLTG